MDGDRRLGARGPVPSDRAATMLGRPGILRARTARPGQPGVLGDRAGLKVYRIVELSSRTECRKHRAA